MKQIYLGGKYGSIIGNYAQVDDEDYEYLNQWKWTAIKKGYTFYAIRGTKGNKNIYIHRVIMNITDSNVQIDHEDHNGLNNQRYNLRKASISQNQMNSQPMHQNKTSIYKGVFIPKNQKKYNAQICVNNKRKHLGVFNDEIEAALAYNEAAIKYHGEFAKLNVIERN